ncbi:MAG: hypothetical protein ACO1RA_17375 [Planctomycetaceae bacterium]
MPTSTVPAGTCPHCNQEKLQCRHNYFDRGDLQIRSFEHRCANCGKRQTVAFRSDDPGPGGLASNGPNCPMCGRLPAEA